MEGRKLSSNMRSLIRLTDRGLEREHVSITVGAFPKAEIQAVAQWIRGRIGEGLLPHEIGVFVRADEQLERAQQILAAAGLSAKTLDAKADTQSGFASILTMHRAKDLEFRAVVVMVCDDEVIPSNLASSPSPTTPTSRMSTTLNGTCCKSLARGRGTSCW